MPLLCLDFQRSPCLDERLSPALHPTFPTGVSCAFILSLPTLWGGTHLSIPSSFFKSYLSLNLYFAGTGTHHHFFFLSSATKVDFESVLVAWLTNAKFLKMPFLMNPLVVCWYKRQEMAGWSLLASSAPLLPMYTYCWYSSSQKKKKMKIFHWKMTALTNFKG